MPYAQIDQYVSNTLAGDVATILNNKAANFPNVAAYYSPTTGYFYEQTVQAVMLGCLDAWLSGNENVNHWLLLSEFDYPGFTNRADIAVIYDNGGGGAASRLFIELKADFTPQSVDDDIEVLDTIASAQHSPITDGYAFYVSHTGDAGWRRSIDDPIEANVFKVGIGVN